MSFAIDRVDHFVLTVRDLKASLRFYERVLGARIVPPWQGLGPTAAAFSRQKINLHVAGREFDPKATHPTVGAGDFCLITEAPIEDVVRRVTECGVTIEVGPVPRMGALGPMTSVYFRDPDGNLVEIAHYGDWAYGALPVDHGLTMPSATASELEEDGGARDARVRDRPHRLWTRIALSSAWSRSAMMSAMLSRPIERRTTSGPAPAAICCSSESWRCVVEAG
jgi:catechol 2,3-dioxygenase-like lactoylglutathione lyase family enzyme